MNRLFRGENSMVSRREAIGGLAAAVAAVAIPGRSWSSTALENVGTKCEYLWFQDEDTAGVYHAYVVEQGEGGTLWMEYDDGNAYQFAPDGWSLERLVVGHRLWLRETDDAWYGYRCLTDAEAEEQLEEV